MVLLILHTVIEVTEACEFEENGAPTVPHIDIEKKHMDKKQGDFTPCFLCLFLLLETRGKQEYSSYIGKNRHDALKEDAQCWRKTERDMS